jgi:geranylgeranyl diphosphate synthase type II
MSFAGWLDAQRGEVDRALLDLLPPEDGPAATLSRAMRYAVFGGGKRLRPVLALAACEAFGGDLTAALAPSCALELVHTYSLVHDDLPAMDDDDLRRGRPTTHKAFGDAAAILAGDALLTLAFEILATRPDGPDAAWRRAEAVAIVARGAGHDGMVGGQIGDLEAEGRGSSRERLDWIHRHKTGALFAAAAELGALHAGASAAERASMARFGHALGLAFQVQDDVLDRTADADALGKTPGKDERSGKATYPALLGLEASRAEAARLADLASEAIPESARVRDRLVDIARSVVDRTR